MANAAEKEVKVNQIFNKYYIYLIVCAKKMLGTTADLAEDLVQETFYRLLGDDNLGKIESIDGNRTRNYLLKILTNIIITSQKKKHINLEFDDNCFYPRKTIDDPTWESYKCKDTKEKLRNLINKLSDRDKIFLFYRMRMELSFYEISELMDVSINYATARLSRIQRKLKKDFLKGE